MNSETFPRNTYTPIWIYANIKRLSVWCKIMTICLTFYVCIPCCIGIELKRGVGKMYLEWKITSMKLIRPKIVRAISFRKETLHFEIFQIHQNANEFSLVIPDYDNLRWQTPKKNQTLYEFKFLWSTRCGKSGVMQEEKWKYLHKNFIETSAAFMIYMQQCITTCKAKLLIRLFDFVWQFMLLWYLLLLLWGKRSFLVGARRF